MVRRCVDSGAVRNFRDEARNVGEGASHDGVRGVWRLVAFLGALEDRREGLTGWRNACLVDFARSCRSSQHSWTWSHTTIDTTE